MLKVLKKNGFASLVEIVITTVIFVLVAFGIFTSISMLRPQGSDAALRLEAAYIGKSVLDELRGLVDARVWNATNSALTPDILHNKEIDNYIVYWQLTDVPSLGIRQVSMNVYSKEGTE